MKKAFRIIPVECPRCDWRIRRELTCTTREIPQIIARTLEEHDLMAHDPGGYIAEAKRDDAADAGRWEAYTR